jgi:glycosyltransferase involved in cell wall biosynthesis
VHGFSGASIVPVYRTYDDIAHYVAISDSDRHPDLHYAATIHHGVDLARFTFESTPGEYLLFLGRIHPDKGTHLAIEVARRAGVPLVIAGIVHDAAYFTDLVAPQLGTDVTYVGSVGPEQRDTLLGGALGLLHPISFEEPFGLSVVESLATGTPVIAFRRGSMAEILRDGSTGFLVDDVAQAVNAVRRLSGLRRSDCRAEVELRFTATRMVGDYAALFASIVAGGPSASRRPSRAGTSTTAKLTLESPAP